MSAPVRWDGGSGNVLARTEPKVRSSACWALVTAAVLFYVHRYAPASVPEVVLAVADGLVTGAVAWVAGYATRAVDRVDLFLAPKVAAAQERVESVAERVVGPEVVEGVEEFVAAIRPGVAATVGGAVGAAVTRTTTAIEAGRDPLAAGKDAAGAAVAAVTAEIPALVAQVGAGPAGEALAARLTELAELVASYRVVARAAADAGPDAAVAPRAALPPVPPPVPPG